MGVVPNGVVTYISKLYLGSISDKEIVQQSGFLNHLTAGDMVSVDKGFVILNNWFICQRAFIEI